MPSSSPAAPRFRRGARQSLQQSSPERSLLADFLTSDRNNELNHREALLAAEKEHTRIREHALHVYHLHEAAEERRRLQEEQAREQERLRVEQAIRAEEERLRALKAKSVPKLPPEPPKAPEQPPAQTKESTASTTTPNGATKAASSTAATAPNGSASSATSANPFAQHAKSSVFGAPSSQSPAPATQPSPFAQAATAQQAGNAASPLQQSTPSIFSQPKPLLSNTPPANPFASQAARPVTNGVATPAQAPPPQKAPIVDRHVIIHRNLKQLRASLDSQARSNQALKSKMGDMRREIRKSVGQLSLDRVGNRKVMEKITVTLRLGLENSVGSELIDPSQFLLHPKEPEEGAVHNGPHMPSLFLYLLNHFSKAILSQFVNECGANTKAADPIGVAAAHVFSEPNFHWRGKSLIDMFISKFRVICPVLFGFRGSEKTQQGRERVGWRRKGGAWITEQEHMDHMTGLGAGYAAIALRDFGKSKKQNPWPPSRYWEAFAKIVNTPASEMSNTQCIVLKAMIENCERRFIGFYGDAAVEALRIALVEFPSIAPEKTSAVRSLEVHGQLLKKIAGLPLS